MGKAADKQSLDELTGNTGEAPEPGHDAWFHEQVSEALKKDKAGQMKYRDLDDVAADFGLDAR